MTHLSTTVVVVVAAIAASLVVVYLAVRKSANTGGTMSPKGLTPGQIAANPQTLGDYINATFGLTSPDNPGVQP